jgi:hypothetical protein
MTMQILTRPTFRESWREATPDERAELIFVLTFQLVILGIMAITAAGIGAIIALAGWPKLGTAVATAMFVIAVMSLYGR